MMNEDGQTIVRITNSLGIPITANDCNVTIWNSTKSIWINAQPMVQGGTAGSWYYDWTTPNATGNYEEYVQCSVSPSNRLVGAGSSFHVSQALTDLTNSLGEPVARIIS